MKKQRKNIYRAAVFAVTSAVFLGTAARVPAGIRMEAAIFPERPGGAAADALLFAKSYEEKLQEAEERRKELERKKNELADQIRENEKKKSDLLAYIEQMDMQILDLNEEIAALDVEIGEAETELAETRLALAEAEKTEEVQYEAMKRRIQYMYENGEGSVLELLLGASSLSELLNRVEYQKKITEYDKQLLASYTEAKLAVGQQKQQLEAELEKLGILKETAEFNMDTLQKLTADKSAEIEIYLAQIEMDEDTFAEYAEQIVRADASIEEIKEEERRRIEEEERRRKEEEARRQKEEEERRRKAEEAAKAAQEAKEAAENESDAKRLAAADSVVERDETDPDKMIWPLPGDGRIYSYFGWRKAPTAGASTYHRGLDIGGVYGARIVASLPGTVSEAGYNASRGNYVAIDHGGGIETYYMHCSKLLVKKGDKVLQGTVIGLVGSTGISTGPHVHFSVKENGNHVDPLKYVSYN